MEFVFSDKYPDSKEEIISFVENFQQGRLLGKGDRNQIRIFPHQGKEINIKSFKVPNAINKIAYRFLRKSKAERSFEYAHHLLSKGIGTPYPIAYAEEKNGFGFRRSFYISEHLQSDLTYRTLVQESHFPEWEKILRAFTRFTFMLHEKQIEFLDHSPGNTLIRKEGEGYLFSLVDLNRMNFKKLTLEERMKNFSRLTPRKDMVEIMAAEYAQLISEPEELIYEKMWGYTREFQKDFQRKKALKKKLKFWKN